MRLGFALSWMLKPPPDETAPYTKVTDVTPAHAAYAFRSADFPDHDSEAGHCWPTHVVLNAA